MTAGGDSTRFEYDDLGNRTGLVYPSGYSVEAGFDDLNRLERIEDPEGNLLAEYAYDAMRRTSTAAFNSGTGVSETLYSYDDANSRPDHLITLENKKIPGGETISRFDYTYDNEGNRLSMAVEPAWGTETGTIAYSYDPIYQLTGAEGPGFPVTWTRVSRTTVWATASRRYLPARPTTTPPTNSTSTPRSATPTTSTTS